MKSLDQSGFFWYSISKIFICSLFFLWRLFMSRLGPYSSFDFFKRAVTQAFKSSNSKPKLSTFRFDSLSSFLDWGLILVTLSYNFYGSIFSLGSGFWLPSFILFKESEEDWTVKSLISLLLSCDASRIELLQCVVWIGKDFLSYSPGI